MQYRKITELKKLPNNPRIIRDKQFKKLCESIKNNPEYFEARPIILSNRTGELVIIAGNQRYEAAKTVRLTEVPTYLIEGLTEEKEKEIIIRDNVSLGEFNFDELANSWDDYPLSEWGLKIPVVDKFEFQNVEFRNSDEQKKKISITCLESDFEEIKKAIINLTNQFPGMAYYV